MKKSVSRTALLAAACLSMGLLSACGSGGDGAAASVVAPDDAIPQSVTTSAVALMDYAKQSQLQISDSTEPATMVQGNLATDDTAEPSAL
ncbi:MAG: hypothetical protein PHI55_16275 [Burkholderiaceae bacterium]|nr:hypothetical protein [Burkholderiaceae bacterium]